ncbi:MAG: amidohydrolase [Nitrospira sp.]|nr:amidohydrolase [Nitrospira sp.]MDH4358186.1 amidohydrolase [Nitrospira sp.]MDH5320627.1 amidohydrolase [Nitrospira sp.]
MNTHTTLVLAALAGILLVTGCALKPPIQAADTVYFGGPILTMEGDAPQYAEALVVKDGKILFVGSLADADIVMQAKNRVDLGGKALLPGFIDAHGHVFLSGIQKLTANLLPPPDGGGKDATSLIALLKEWQRQNAAAVKKSGWIIGFGYDDAQLAEQRHPTADDLDQVSVDIPAVVIHQSGHLAVMNHKGLALAGFTAESPDPAGGVIRREDDGRTPNGVLEEMAFFGPIFQILGALDEDANERIALAGVQAYTQFGFTTAQEGRASKAASETWRRLANKNRLVIDVAVYPDIQAEAEYVKQVGVSPTYRNHVRVAGVKLSLDGSPQGKTAWLSEPYVVPPPGQPTTYVGYPAIPEADERQRLVDLAFRNNWQLLTHCNGDAAADALIGAIAKAEATYGKGDRRPVMIHAQTVREDQLDRMQTLAIVPSYFSMHTFYWGDWHRDETLGTERAYRISPTASTLRRGMKFTEHHDAPVALPSAVMILYATVNRISRSGDVIGPDERVSPFVALKSITEWAAWQYFEEDRKGTLAPGKLADLVILDKDPTKVEPKSIRGIKVIETIKEGRTVYKAE